MKMKGLVFLCLLICLVMAGSLSVWAAGSAERQAKGTDDGLEQVQLRFVLRGSGRPDQQVVLDKISELTRDELNITLKFDFIPASDYAERLNVMLVAGEDFDAMLSAQWLNYIPLLQRGALAEIGEVMEEYAPNLVNAYPEGYLDAIRYKGGLYGIPWNFPTSQRSVIYLRRDIAKAYNLETPDIQSMDDIESLLMRIKVDYPDFIPFGVDKNAGRNLVRAYMASKGWILLNGNFNYLLFYRQDDPNMTVVGVENIPEYREFVEYMNRWHQKGLIPRNPLAISETQEQLLQGGRVAAVTHTMGSFNRLNDLALPGTDMVGMAHFHFEPSTPALNAPPTNNLFVVNRNSKNIERLMMFFNWVFADQANYDLLLYGIEGEHWVLEADGKVGHPAGIDAASNRYQGWQSQWPLWIEGYRRYLPSEDEVFIQAREESLTFNQIIPRDISFFPDLENVQTETANRTSLVADYFDPLNVGLRPVTDIETARQRANAAGYNKLVEEVNKQITEFLR